MHVLILGGTSEASALARLLADHSNIRATLSLAGRTQHPVLPPIPYRIGGFGGAEGLAQWIKDHDVTALVDATHPFAKVMPFNAARAARESHIPLLSLMRPGWQLQAGDDWLFAADHAEVMALLGTAPHRIFLTVGRMELPAYAAAPQHFYLVRSIDPVNPKPLPNAVWLTRRGPFSVENEQALLREYAIDTLISKNSGGDATKAKLDATRMRGCRVILIDRPPRPQVECVTTADAALEWILRIHAISS